MTTESQKTIGILSIVLGACGGLALSAYAFLNLLASGMGSWVTSSSDTGRAAAEAHYESLLRLGVLGGLAAVTLGIVLIVRARRIQRRPQPVTVPVARALA